MSYKVTDFKRCGENAFTFGHFDEFDLVVTYPTRNYPYFNFYCVDEKDNRYEVDLPNSERLEIVGIIMSMELDNFWEDDTNWSNIVCQ